MDVSDHLDADVLLPPRKRLLAGLKRQSCSESTSQYSHENNQSPSLSPSPSPSPLSQAPLTEFDIRVNNLLRSYKTGSNMSPEEIAKAARVEAFAAAKAAEVAKAAAEVKAALAAKAVADAKTALDLVASISEDMSGRDKYLRKNKLKKQVPVQLLYKKYQAVENCGKDEEFARKLHQTINSSPRIARTSPGSDSKDHKLKMASSPRISRTSPGSDSKDHKLKKLKISSSKEKDGNLKLPLETGVDCELSSEKTHSVIMDDKVSKSGKTDELEVTSREVKTPMPSEDVCVINGRKRGRIKQKKLPLSICSLKDQTRPKEPNVKKSLFSCRARADKTTTHHVSSLSIEPSSGNVKPIEFTPTWKCEDFRVPQCIKQDKLVQS